MWCTFQVDPNNHASILAVAPTNELYQLLADRKGCTASSRLVLLLPRRRLAQGSTARVHFDMRQ